MSFTSSIVGGYPDLVTRIGKYTGSVSHLENQLKYQWVLSRWVDYKWNLRYIFFLVWCYFGGSSVYRYIVPWFSATAFDDCTFSILEFKIQFWQSKTIWKINQFPHMKLKRKEKNNNMDLTIESFISETDYAENIPCSHCFMFPLRRRDILTFTYYHHSLISYFVILVYRY